MVHPSGLDHDLRVQVTATVYLTRTATSAGEAIDALTRQCVWDALSASDIDCDAEEDN